MNKVKNYSLGQIFKKIREDVFGVSLIELSSLINTSSSAYNRLEKDNFGKSFEAKKNSILNYWAQNLAAAILEESERNGLKLNIKLKETLLEAYTESNYYDENKMYYFEKYECIDLKSIEEFIFNVLLIFSGEKNINITNTDSISSYIKNQDLFRLNNSILGKVINFKELKNCIVKVIEISNPTNILEIGFGTGLTAVLISQLFPEIKIVAIDNRPEMMNIAKKNAAGYEGIDFKLADINFINTIGKLPELVLMNY